MIYLLHEFVIKLLNRAKVSLKITITSEKFDKNIKLESKKLFVFT